MNKRNILLAILFIEILLIAFVLYIYNPFLQLRLNGSEIVKINIGSEYIDQGAKASYFKDDLTSKIKIEGKVDTDKLGEYTLKYILKRGDTVREVSRKVIVADLASPEITLVGNNEVVLCGKEYVEDGYKAIDNIDGDITNKVETKKESNRIIYSVTDNSGNKKEVVRVLIPGDNVNPVITLKKSDILTFEENSEYKEFGATATDNCDGDISSKIEIISNVDTSKHEIFEVIYKVKDSNGNEGIAKRKVKIYNHDDLNKGYKEIIEGPTYIKNILIVNKKYSVPKNFKADNQGALKALKELQNAAKEAGHSMPLKSGYRDYNYQKALYEKYKNKNGIEYADIISAHPGHSEHQTGLAFDVGIGSVSFGRTPAGIWLNENCAKYGFIIRYPEYKQAITGYKYEPWHIRYVGIEVATEIMAKEITLEEYLGIYDINN